MEFSTAVYDGEGRMKKEEMGWLLEKEWNWGRGEECMVLCIGHSIPLIFIDEINKPTSFS